MSDNFDPYYQWLGIPPNQQPPDYYRLLGLQSFEDNEDVISNVSDQRMIHIRTYQGGKRAAESQRLLNELAAARICLLNPVKKAAYDQQLREAERRKTPVQGPPLKSVQPIRVAPAQPRPPVTIPQAAPILPPNSASTLQVAPLLPPPAHPFLVGSQSQFPVYTPLAPVPPHKSQPINASNPVVIAFAGLGTLLLAGIVLLVVLLGSRPSSRPVAAKPPPAAVVAKPVPSATQFPAVPQPPPQKVSPQPAIPAIPQTTVTAASGSTVGIDIMPLIDVNQHTLGGRVERNGKFLQTFGGRPDMFKLPVTPPDEYELTAVVTRTSLTQSITIGLVCEGKSGSILIDGYPEIGFRSGVNGIRGQDCANRSDAYKGQLLTNGVPATIHCKVGKGTIVVTCDGRQIVNWKGDPNDLTVSLFYGPRARGMFVASWEATYSIQKLEFKPLSKNVVDSVTVAQGTNPAVATVNPSVPLPNETPDPTPAAAGTGRTINLISLINPQQDKIFGDWHLENGELVCTSTHFVPKIYVPYQPPEEYDLKIVWSQPSIRHGISAIIPKGGNSFIWGIGNARGEMSFSVQTANGVANPTESRAAEGFQPGRKYTTVIQIRKNRVRATADGKQVASYDTDYKDLRAGPWHRIPDTSRLAIACDDPTTFHVIEMEEITGTGKKLR